MDFLSIDFQDIEVFARHLSSFLLFFHSSSLTISSFFFFFYPRMAMLVCSQQASKAIFSNNASEVPKCSSVYVGQCFFSFNQLSKSSVFHSPLKSILEKIFSPSLLTYTPLSLFHFQLSFTLGESSTVADRWCRSMWSSSDELCRSWPGSPVAPWQTPELPSTPESPLQTSAEGQLQKWKKRMLADRS